MHQHMQGIDNYVYSKRRIQAKSLIGNETYIGHLAHKIIGYLLYNAIGAYDNGYLIQWNMVFYQFFHGLFQVYHHFIVIVLLR